MCFFLPVFVNRRTVSQNPDMGKSVHNTCQTANLLAEEPVPIFILLACTCRNTYKNNAFHLITKFVQEI